MSCTSKHVVLFITCAHYNEADMIAKKLLTGKLIACANILLHSESIFWWQKKINRASEIVIIAKSTTAKVNAVIKKVKQLHSYKVPEIIALPIIAGSGEYLDCIDSSVK